MQFPSRQRGVSLIEVMMAVLIFSIGLIGLAGLLVMATRSNHAAYLRTQVTFLAHNMADRMRANPIGVWNGDYDKTSYKSITGSTPACDNAAPCSPADLAKHDQKAWSDQLAVFLPDADAKIQCTANTNYTPSATQYDMQPPYGGNCAMTITWSERGAGDKNNRAAVMQTFAWNFQP